MNIKKVTKRQPLAQKYAIEKKVRSHTRKMRKAAHKNAGAIRKRVSERKAGMSIPSSCPFKADILRTLQKRNEKRKQEKLDKLSARRLLRISGPKDTAKPLLPIVHQLNDPDDDGTSTAVDSTPSRDDASCYAGLLASAASKGSEFAAKQNAPTVEEFHRTDRGQTTITTKKTFPRPGSKELLSITSVRKIQKPQGKAPPSFFAATSQQQQNIATTRKNNNRRRAPIGGGSSTSTFVKQLHQLIEESDVVVVVLDVRDPLSCRSQELERHLIGKGKKVVLLLNKIDLVPTEAVKAWLVYLRREHPTIAFKSVCGTSMRAAHNRTSAVAASDGLKHNSSQVLGASALIQLIKNYARTSGGSSGNTDEVVSGDVEMGADEEGGMRGGNTKKASITVGIIGYPNVGKSSVINSLKRSPGSAATGGVCGVTRQLQYLSLDKQVRLVDSPGVVLSGTDSDPSTVLRNAVSVTAVKDPESVVEFLLTRCCSADQLKLHFKISPFDTPNQFLANVAQARGKLLKGGAPDIAAASRLVITEWSSGKIPYYCMPPKDNDEFASSLIVNSSFTSDPDALDALMSVEERTQQQWPASNV
eukprot:GHVS01081557.1.p1 GENE.GHVS01081557.1~~GHVS01081557.1.p1  ORF type:complete len:588 (-),score=82.48 GHVS01081557.1:5-1768(-)